MKSRAASLGLLLAIVVAAPAVVRAGYITRSDIEKQNEHFKQWWGNDLEWRYAELPGKGKVPTYRMPYAGYIYPDRQAGCAAALRKYDYAFNYGRGSAAGFEAADIA
ncbi:MAG: hypothetical protein KDA41_04165, partial [Planctomycetales bacterium]|nr:hypothetical protein [Planctomycetales bacterium]